MGCFLALSILFLLIGIVQLLTPDKKSSQQSVPYRAPRPQTPMRTSAPITSNSPAAVSTPAPVRQPATGLSEAAVSNPAGGHSMSNPLSWITQGTRIVIQHPVQGKITLFVEGQVNYSELWQTSRGAQSPWVPTGNKFYGYWLQTNLFLLNWQNRFYILDEYVPLSDPDIQRDFAPYAKQFAQSDQKADVYFSYPPAMWHIDDIGKFRIDQVQGGGFRAQVGAVGRFIHSSGADKRALIVEDYEGGGGQDAAWVGYQIDLENISKE